MAGLPWPGSSEFDASSWDTTLLGGTLLPGVVEIDITGEMDIDEGKSGDKHGANLKFKGFKPRKVELTWKIWDRGPSDEQMAQTQADWDTMQTFLDENESTDGKQDVSPLQIFNIKTAARNLYSVAIKSIKGPDWDAGTMTVKLSLIEWNKPAAAPAKGLGTAKTEKATSPGSEWEQVPDENGNISTTATKNAPHNTDTGP